MFNLSLQLRYREVRVSEAAENNQTGTNVGSPITATDPDTHKADLLA